MQRPFSLTDSLIIEGRTQAEVFTELADALANDNVMVVGMNLTWVDAYHSQLDCSNYFELSAFLA